MASDLKAQIQSYLVESGNYEKISNALNDKLLQDGWADKVRDLTMQEIRSSNQANYKDVLEKIEPQALEMVSQNTRDDTLAQIKAFLEDIVETE
ncbi:Sus1p KNAG_0B01445 [Huiozyma naganishii CBS 8797]|uniref:Transcription and mRNA export factor SUS1 n=1 Tax=Huiozyma naganishii (strain ATCC MYA-139 / BCRC 22969 / CBS 8797 / KCTC 17520 / NBRC 10181 / NCYC 3082 / Yp74L-3) TaxID=1071383 RepID=J7RUR1_HUIN7|nr:hypothetical protein KNAG_0B01445 [Kazachstania naganishii CBS 8797]CCK68592.1 hypothetical protein KNAG_0B01445 [Kazachstania naganishii CBS 8797]